MGDFRLIWLSRDIYFLCELYKLLEGEVIISVFFLMQNYALRIIRGYRQGENTC